MNINIEENTSKVARPYGKIVTFSLPMEAYSDKRTRTIRVWLPKSYNGKRRFPVLYMHDAQNLFDGLPERSGQAQWYVEREMCALEKEGLPTIIVGIDNAPTRLSELCPNGIHTNADVISALNERNELVPTGNLYSEFITVQLKTFIDHKFMTLPDAANTAIGGSSMGGLISLYMAFKYPYIFSKAMVFAPFFSILDEHEVMSKLENYDFTKLRGNRIFIFHGGLGLDAMSWPNTRIAFETMRVMGMDDTHLALLYDSRQPHHESAWQKYFAEAFRYLFLKNNDLISSSSGTNGA